MYTTGSGGPAPGWYPDPAGEKAWRWWDGSRWTGYASDPAGTATANGGAYGATAGAPASPQYPAYPQYYAGSFGAPSAHQRFAAEQRLAPWATRALIAFVIVEALNWVNQWESRAALRNLFHQIRVAIDSGQQTTFHYSRSPGSIVVSYVVGLIAIGIYVVFLMWQYRAATTARQLGLATTHSPGLGVGGWFIPVVNLWFPYQAIRDCLPEEDRRRARVLAMWLTYIASNVLSIVGILLVFFASTALGVVFTVLSVLSLSVFALLAIRVVRSISEAHRRLLIPNGTGTDPTSGQVATAP